MSPIIELIGGAKAYGWGKFVSAPDLGAMFPIASTTLSVTSTVVTFTGIPSTYTHLQVRALVRSGRTGYSNDGFRLTFNGDTSTNYSRHKLDSADSGIDAGSTTSSNFIFVQGIAGALPDSAVFGFAIVDILDYAHANKYKVSQNFSAMATNVNSGENRSWASFSSGVWKSTSAITSMTFKTFSSENQLPGTSYYLYGIKDTLDV